MDPAPHWSSFHRTLPDGVHAITSTALLKLGQRFPDRIIDTELWGKPAKVILLEVPFHLGGRVESSEVGEYSLHQVRLHALPGWPPKIASVPDARSIPDILECTLADAFLYGGPGQESLGLALRHSGRKYRAWIVGCPMPLLKCAEETLKQDSVMGRKLVDIQDVKLIGAGENAQEP